MKSNIGVRLSPSFCDALWHFFLMGLRISVLVYSIGWLIPLAAQVVIIAFSQFIMPQTVTPTVTSDSIDLSRNSTADSDQTSAVPASDFESYLKLALFWLFLVLVISVSMLAMLVLSAAFFIKCCPCFKKLQLRSILNMLLGKL